MLAGLLLLAAAVPQEAAADSLAPARAGKVRCVSPNAAKRTCQAIIRYKVGADGGFDARVFGIVSPDGEVVLDYETFGRIENGGVCTMMRRTDIEKGRLLQRGVALPSGPDGSMRLRLLGAFEPLAGKKRCFIDRADDKGDLSSIVTLDGVAQPEMTQRVAWVLPSEGWSLGK